MQVHLYQKKKMKERKMAEQFLTLMADLDEDSQKLMSGWYDRLKKAAFVCFLADEGNHFG